MGKGHRILGRLRELFRGEPAQPPCNVIPIVFVPGIAGSNLRIKKDCQNTVRARLQLQEEATLPDPWRPPNGIYGGIKAVNEWNNYRGLQRQALLNLQTTEVDDEGFLEGGSEGFKKSPYTKDGKNFRGWGSVHAKSYGDYLIALEYQANAASYHRMPPDLKEKGRSRVFIPHALKVLMVPSSRTHFVEIRKRNGLLHCELSFDQIDTLLCNLMPVYVSGYNWLACNKTSAEALLENIRKIIQLYNDAKTENGAALYTCKDVILVTHSMGGLVARCAVQNDSHKTIRGVVHAAMPAVGTPAAYRRMVAGVELEVPADAFFLPHYRNAVSVLMGRNAEETTPVMANSAGCLELLPTGDYPKNWLVASGLQKNGQRKQLFALPKVDPYREIYEQKEAWYRLVDPTLLDPGMLNITETGGAWGFFSKRLKDAKDFHINLNRAAAGQLPTYACYGSDFTKRTFGTVRWHLTRVQPPQPFLEEQIQGASAFYSHHGGTNRVARGPHVDADGSMRELDFQIQEQDTGGDGTVSWQSGRAPEDYGLKGRIWPLSGFDHQYVFDSGAVRLFILWSICKIIGETK